MGRIIGNKKANVKTFTEQEVIELTADLNTKIVELTAENVKIKNEFDEKNETIENLNTKIVELTAEIKSSKKEKDASKTKQINE